MPRGDKSKYTDKQERKADRGLREAWGSSAGGRAPGLGNRQQR